MLVRVMPNYTRRQSYLYTIVSTPCRNRLGIVRVGTVRGAVWRYLQLQVYRYCTFLDPFRVWEGVSA